MQFGKPKQSRAWQLSQKCSPSFSSLVCPVGSGIQPTNKKCPNKSLLLSFRCLCLEYFVQTTILCDLFLPELVFDNFGMFSWSVWHVCSPLNSEGHQSFDIWQRGSWEFLWYSDPSERNHSNHGLLWNSFAPSPLMPQTDPPHIRRTSIPAHTYIHTCVYLNVLDCVVFVWLNEYMHICFSVCYPACLLGGPAPGVRGVLHFQLRRELGLLCGNTPAKSVIYCPQRTRRDWQCFLKPSSRPRGRQQPPQPRLTLLASPQNLQTKITAQTEALASTPG